MRSGSSPSKTLAMSLGFMVTKMSRRDGYFFSFRSDVIIFSRMTV